MVNPPKCSISWCQDESIEPAGLCPEHIRDLKPGDPRLGPEISFVRQNLRPRQLPRGLGKFFFLTTDKYGRDCMSEVPESFYAPEVPVNSPAEAG